jgi:hypothetical protein
MQPHIINPLVFGYDPYFENPDDWRYYWKWITKSKWELQRLIKSGTITGVSSVKEIVSGIDPFLYDYKQRRDKAKKAMEPSIDPADGDVYQILEFFGHDENGKKCVYWLDKGFTHVLMKEELDLRDGDDVLDASGKVVETMSKWPIVVKEAFREPHSSVVFSVADLLEDKHRAKSVLLNLAYIAAKDRANPIYGYNPDKVKDISQFFSRQINQHIPMDDDTAAWPLNTQDPMSAGLIQFISMLTTEANDPVGTGMVGQPQQDSGSDTATEAAITQQMNDMAQSLQSKVMQFGEAEFWGHWFHRYARYGKECKEKMANIVGAKGVDSIVIDLADFQTNYPPGVLVYSAKDAEYKELVKRRDLMQLYPQLAQSMTPDSIRNFNKYVFFPLFLEDPSLIDVILPDTIDELKAQDENEQLRRDLMPDVAETDNHETHIYAHSSSWPKTWATWIHIQWHQDLLAQQKQMEMQQAQMQMQAEAPQPKVGAEKKSPMQAATPLKAEINPNNSIK